MHWISDQCVQGTVPTFYAKRARTHTQCKGTSFLLKLDPPPKVTEVARVLITTAVVCIPLLKDPYWVLQVQRPNIL